MAHGAPLIEKKVLFDWPLKTYIRPQCRRQAGAELRFVDRATDNEVVIVMIDQALQFCA